MSKQLPQVRVLDMAGELGKVLLDIECPEQRSIALAGIIKVLACTVDGTDAKCPLIDVASDIEHQAQENIEAATPYVSQRDSRYDK